jgi:rhodanese-related sulfurtransferase
MTTRLFLTLALSCLCNFTFAEDKTVTHVDANEAEKLVKEGKVTVVDVRSPEEYKEEHIAKAQNVDCFTEDFAQQLDKLDKSKPYLVHCASGKRSTSSLKIFEKLGFKNLFHLDGGIAAWKQAGKPVEK